MSALNLCLLIVKPGESPSDDSSTAVHTKVLSTQQTLVARQGHSKVVFNNLSRCPSMSTALLHMTGRLAAPTAL